ncbi:MAG: archaetidylserine decarboxylase [Bradymonadia bacterium]|jgi:phosphatidylserine decarboxylase
MSSLKDRAFIGALSLLPRNALSRGVGRLAHLELPAPFGRFAVRRFAEAYGIDMEEAEHGLDAYPSIGALFVRRLRLGARPVDRRRGVAVSPADGRVLNFGRIEEGTLVQAKGRNYRVSELLGDAELGACFEGGAFVTVYLSPRDYHRVHHPAEGRIVSARHIPGHLWPVNRAAVEQVQDLFCVNERLVTVVEGPLGRVATVMVGATSVGDITAAYDESLETNRGGAGTLKTYARPIEVARGDELGTFHLGSTAVVVFDAQDLAFEPLEPDQPIRMGQAIARRTAQK